MLGPKATRTAAGPRRRIVIAGGSGFIGLSLAERLACAGDDVVVLSRGAAPSERRTPIGCARRVPWTGRRGGSREPWWEEVDRAAAIVNLAGRSVNCVKSPDRRDEILRSRVESTLALGEAVRAATHPPPVWVQMSTAHIYGDPPEVICDESSPTGYGLAPDVARAWEAAVERAAPADVRRVLLRTGFVLGRDRGAGAGALETLGLIARLGLGGAVGSGHQGMSWIHEVDFNRIVERALEEDSMRGVYVVSAPNPLEQRVFMRELRRRAGGLGRLGIGLPAFGWMVRLAAPILLRTDPELALYGRFVMPRRLVQEGFEFRFPHLPTALDELFRSEGAARSPF